MKKIKYLLMVLLPLMVVSVFKPNYSTLLEDINNHKYKQIINSSSFDMSEIYNINEDGHSPNDYIENLNLIVNEREGSSQLVEIEAPYSIYQSQRYIYGQTIVNCETKENESVVDDIMYDVWSLEYNDQPHIRNVNDIEIKGYLDDTYVSNLSFSLIKGINDENKYYLQGLKLNISLIEGINNYRLCLSNVYFTTGYQEFNVTQLDSTKHVVSPGHGALYDYYNTVSKTEEFPISGSTTISSISYNQSTRTRVYGGIAYTYSGNKTFASIKSGTVNNGAIYYKSDNNILLEKSVKSGRQSDTYNITWSFTLNLTYEEEELVAHDVETYDGTWTKRVETHPGSDEISHQDITVQTRWNDVISSNNIGGEIRTHINIYTISSDRYLLINTSKDLSGYYLTFENVLGVCSNDIPLSIYEGSNYDYYLFGVYIPISNSLIAKWNRFYLKNNNKEVMTSFTYNESSNNQNVFFYNNELTPISSIDNNEIIYRWFGTYFLSLINCTGKGNYSDQTMIVSNWPILETYYSQLNNEYKEAIGSAQVTGSDDLTSALMRYDYIVFYKNYPVNDFLNRSTNPSRIYTQSTSFNPLMTLAYSESHVTTIVLIFGTVVSIFSLIMISTLLYKRKKQSIRK